MGAPVEFSEMEMRFYWAITRLVRKRVERARDRFSAFHLVGPQLRMASCIPAMVDAYRQGQLGDFKGILFDLYEAGIDDGESPFRPDDDDGSRSPSKGTGNTISRATDLKYAAFRDVVVKRLPGKNRYLFVLQGNTPLPAPTPSGRRNRDRVDRRRNDRAGGPGRRTRAVRQADVPCVLLSSEVGSEGMNLQFARVIINYDLPWNPMRIEQRIGRIDRVGQLAERLIIVRFKVRGTIEERLYDRLHEKLEAFRNSLGDLEAVIGEEISKLTADLFRRELTPAEEETRIIETQRVIKGKLEEQIRLEENIRACWFLR